MQDSGAWGLPRYGEFPRLQLAMDRITGFQPQGSSRATVDEDQILVLLDVPIFERGQVRLLQDFRCRGSIGQLVTGHPDMDAT